MPAKPFVNKQGGFTVFLKLHSDILSFQSLSVTSGFKVINGIQL